VAPLWQRISSLLGSGDLKKVLAVLVTAYLLARKAGGRIVMRNGKTVVFAPSFLYDLIARMFFFPNWAICAACYVQPELSEWNEPTSVTVDQLKKMPGEDLAVVRADLLARRDRAYKEVDIVRLFDACEPANAQRDMIGHTWNGKIVRTNGSVLDLAEWCIVRPLSAMGVNWGKRYLTQHTGDPLLFNVGQSVYFPVPLWGNVCMTGIEWRGRSLATMNYDHQPWKDYFVVLSKPTPEAPDAPTVVLGVWTSKDKAGGWFTLTRADDVPVQ